MLKSLDRNLNKLYKFSGYVAAFFLILVAVFILIGISSRIFGFYIRGLAEYSGYCMAAASFFALAYTFVEGGHIRITLFLEKMSGMHEMVPITVTDPSNQENWTAKVLLREVQKHPYFDSLIYF